ncbi:hypothetical protein TeGR_g15176, partial [Tetraparma gracilis]
VPEKLVDLFKQRQLSYDSYFRRESEQIVQQKCVLWETIPDFYEKRAEIASDIEDAIREVLESNHAELISLQLHGITLQQTTEQKIIETLIAEQEELTETILQQSTVVRAEKEEFAVDAAAEVTVINSEANALGIEIRATSEAIAFQAVTDAQSNKLASIEAGLGLGTAGKLLTYMWYSGFGTLADPDKMSVVLGINGATQAELAGA